MMSWMQSATISMGIGILKMALPMISDGLKVLMVDAVKKWKAYAETTTYDWDNLVVKALWTLLSIPGEAEEQPSDPPAGSATVEITGPVVRL